MRIDKEKKVRAAFKQQESLKREKAHRPRNDQAEVTGKKRDQRGISL